MAMSDCLLPVGHLNLLSSQSLLDCLFQTMSGNKLTKLILLASFDANWNTLGSSPFRYFERQYGKHGRHRLPVVRNPLVRCLANGISIYCDKNITVLFALTNTNTSTAKVRRVFSKNLSAPCTSVTTYSRSKHYLTETFTNGACQLTSFIVISLVTGIDCRPHLVLTKILMCMEFATMEVISWIMRLRHR